MPIDPEEFPLREFKIPLELIKEFKEEPRIVFRDGFPIGIPVPDIRLLDRLKTLKGYQIVLVPTEIARH